NERPGRQERGHLLDRAVGLGLRLRHGAGLPLRLGRQLVLVAVQVDVDAPGRDDAEHGRRDQRSNTPHGRPSVALVLGLVWLGFPASGGPPWPLAGFCGPITTPRLAVVAFELLAGIPGTYTGPGCVPPVGTIVAEPGIGPEAGGAVVGKPPVGTSTYPCGTGCITGCAIGWAAPYVPAGA